MGDLRRWLRMPAVERRATVMAIWLLPMTALLVRALGLRRCLRLGRSLTTRRPDASALVPRRAQKLVAGVAARLPLATSCLERSLALWMILGAGPEALRIGVRHDPGAGFDAHAWIEHRGLVLDATGNDPSAYQPFAALSPPRA